MNISTVVNWCESVKMYRSDAETPYVNVSFFGPMSNTGRAVGFFLFPSGKLLVLRHIWTSPPQTCGWGQSGLSDKHKEQALFQLLDSHVRAKRTGGLVRAQCRRAAWRSAKQTSIAALQEALLTAGPLALYYCSCKNTSATVEGSQWVIWGVMRIQNRGQWQAQSLSRGNVHSHYLLYSRTVGISVSALMRELPLFLCSMLHQQRLEGNLLSCRQRIFII